MSYFLSPTRERREPAERGEKSVCFYKGEDIPFRREKGTHHLLGMVTMDPDDHLKGALHGLIGKAVTHP
jgi:hypothetical protein